MCRNARVSSLRTRRVYRGGGSSSLPNAPTKTSNLLPRLPPGGGFASVRIGKIAIPVPSLLNHRDKRDGLAIGFNSHSRFTQAMRTRRKSPAPQRRFYARQHDGQL